MLPAEKSLIHLRGENEILVGYAAGVMRRGRYIHSAPSQVDVRVMALRFRQRSHAVHKSQGGLEIGKKKGLG